MHKLPPFIAEALSQAFGPIPGGPLDPDRPVKEQVEERMIKEIQDDIGVGDVILNLLIAKGVFTQEELDNAVQAERDAVAEKVKEKFKSDPEIATLVGMLEERQQNLKDGKCSCGKPLGHGDDEDEVEEELVEASTETVVTDKTTIVH